MRSKGKIRSGVVFRRGAMVPLVAAVIGCLSGCYEFSRVDPMTAPVGARVRAELTPGGSARMAEVFGDGDRSRIEGRVLETSTDGGVLMEVASTSGATPVGVSGRPLFARVSLPGSEIMWLELKELDKGRTAALVGASAAVAAIIVKAAFDIGGGGTGEDNGPPVDQILIPFFSISVGR